MRIGVGGIAHETNTFSTLITGLEDFRVRRGEECVVGGLWDRFRAEGVEFAPTLIAGATPNGLVSLDAYQTLKSELLERLSAALPIDGLYLSLHGAMEVQEIGDGETDLVVAVRDLVGPDPPISVSLDLHGNLSPELIASANVFTALRTAPHVDGAETRERALRRLIRCVKDGRRPVTAMVKLPLLLPGENAVTSIEPSKSLYGRLLEIEQGPGVWDASLMIACAWTDSPYTSVSTLVVADDEALAMHHAKKLADEVWNRRAEFGPEVETVSLSEAIAQAAACVDPTMFISDSGDNPTAGGAGDVPVFLSHLLDAKLRKVLVAGLVDAEAVARCEAAGPGANVELKLGGKLDHTNAKPLSVSALVARASGKDAVINVGGATVLLTADRRPFHTFSAFEPFGEDPLSYPVVVVKQGYLSPDLRERCSRTIMALTPGFTDLRLEGLPYRKIRRPIYPLDPL